MMMYDSLKYPSLHTGVIFLTLTILGETDKISSSQHTDIVDWLFSAKRFGVEGNKSRPSTEPKVNFTKH